MLVHSSLYIPAPRKPVEDEATALRRRLLANAPSTAELRRWLATRA